jgi:hypothetical protein
MRKHVWQDGENVADRMERPDYLGMVWDGQPSFNKPGLKPLAVFPWFEYQELADIDGGERFLSVPFPVGGEREVRYELYADVAFVLEQIPGIEVVRDDGPPNPSPGSGSGHDVYLSKGSKVKDVTANVTALLSVLQSDLDALRDKHPELD